MLSSHRGDARLPRLPILFAQTPAGVRIIPEHFLSENALNL
jgi:hypothetical protein